MSGKLVDQSRQAALKHVGFQALLVLAVTLICGLASGLHAGLSALVGGAIYIVPNLVFVWLAFAYAGARQSKSVVMSLYLGEVVKLILTIVMLAIALAWMELDIFSLYLAFAVALVAQWSIPFFFNHNSGMKNGCSR
ncbi:ATP synthase subunit I [Motilimonas sp. 1_MG-2023]|uniref:ATP synthase subunit I n=1 Tax=Motilimonas TaxID=1914248 RepID=UPI001E6242F3|nr:ATP synthase subunit I [Motilimonas sp. 1_MG-2023]MCE0559341.1 ATP synthase subunit I [Motilimonas sp. E26]MDO6525893.1 ATP synthase subunit I [Motilimonas sp. 1_MG-2023]